MNVVIIAIIVAIILALIITRDDCGDFKGIGTLLIAIVFVAIIFVVYFIVRGFGVDLWQYGIGITPQKL